MSNTKALVAEFVGTFALIFIGAGAGVVSGNIVAVALALGLVVLWGVHWPPYFMMACSKISCGQ